MSTITEDHPFDLPPGVEAIPVDADIERSRWLELREGGIGGSDASAIIGANQYTTPFQVWHDKTHRRTKLPYEQSNEFRGFPSEEAYWGTKLEPVIADAFAEITNMEIINPKFMFFDTREGFPRYANMDRVAFDPELEAWIPVEIKTASAYLAEDWSGDVPADHANAQVHHYGPIVGASHAWVVALVGGQKLRMMRVELDRRLADGILELERQFWTDYVEPLIPPPTEGEDLNVIASLLELTDTVAHLPDAAIDIWDRIVGAKETIAEAKASMDDDKVRLATMLENHTKGVVAGATMCSWGAEPDPLDDNMYIPAEAQRRLRAAHPDLFDAFAVPGKPKVRRFNVNYKWTPTITE